MRSRIKNQESRPLRFKTKHLPLASCVLLLAILQGSCLTEDTCNDELGKTFGTVVPMRIDTNDNRIHLEYSWSVMDTLPDNYFTDATVYDRTEDPYGQDILNAANAIESIDIRKDGMSVSLYSDSIAMKDDRYYIGLHLVFGDREDYIPCRHPGSKDTYYLNTYTTIGFPGKTEIDLEWDEKLELGGY